MIAAVLSDGDVKKHLDWLSPSAEQVQLDRDLAGRPESDKSIIRALRAVGAKKRAKPRK